GSAEQQRLSGTTPRLLQAADPLCGTSQQCLPDELPDLAHLLLLKFVSELMAARVDQMLPGLEEEEEVGVREEVMRRHLPLSQRERKAGCRNFFWKTFTSC
uniref:Somatostatin/Cortistatin C-terminal domain-containing protein n=1 Tax=Seriola lalandi dorsalis TaxID=1841481 RepID=A0A3B4YGB2_SERLL